MKKKDCINVKVNCAIPNNNVSDFILSFNIFSFKVYFVSYKVNYVNTKE